MMKKINDFLAGWLMTVVGGVFLLLSFILPRVGMWKQTGPFYCMRYTAPNYISTLGGVHTGRDSEVLDAKDQAIPGLYAVGMLGTELWPGDYTCGMPGGANAFNVDSGRRAVRHAAAWCI